jgi:tetratricopeptide (TPR) repeat protein
MKPISLLDPKYMGGLDGASGYRFEDGYVLSQLPSWLSLPGLKAFQQEGWSDVELFFEFDRRWLIQIKDHRIKISELREIIHDFSAREAESSGQYEQYIIASTGLTRPGEQIRRQLERLRTAQFYTKPELAGTRMQVVSKLEQFKLGNLADFIIEKVFFDSDIAEVKHEEKLRHTFVGSLGCRYEVLPETAEDLYLRTAHLLTIERGKPIELSLFQEALRQKQLEDQADALTHFYLVTPRFLDRYRCDETRSFFYDGAVPTWSDIINQRDIPREIMNEILSRVKQWDEGKLLVPILAEAGEGKSTLLRRMAVELAAENKIVLYHRRDVLTVDVKEVQRVAEMSGQCVYVFIDDASRVQNFSGFIESLAELPFPIVVNLRSVYSANVELGVTADGREYSLEGLTDHEMELLFRRLADEGLIRPLSDEDLQLAIDFHGKRTKRKLLVLVLEMTRGKRVKEIVRDEIERVRKMGEDIFSAYRYICLMASVHSFFTLPMLGELVSIDNVELDVVGRLPGLVETIGERVYLRHDRIGEIATDLLFSGANDQRGDLLCQLISLAFKEGQLDVVKSMIGAVSRSIPRSQLFKVIGHLVDEAYCAGEFDLVRTVIGEFQWDLDSEDIFLDLLAAKTPLIWEQMVFPSQRSPFKMSWGSMQKTWNLPFSWFQCSSAIESEPVARGSPEIGLRWAEVFYIAARHGAKHKTFFTVITQLMYAILSALHQDRAAEIDFYHGEFLRATFRDEDAIRLYHCVLEKDPHYAQAHAGLALSLYLTHDYEGALYHYRTARELDRESVFRVEFEGVFGEMLERLGELEELIEYQKDSFKWTFRVHRRLRADFGNIMRIADLKVPRTSAEGRWIEERERDYSEEAEQTVIDELDELLELVRTLPKAQQEELGKRLSGSWFGELREKSPPGETMSG